MDTCSWLLLCSISFTYADACKTLMCPNLEENLSRLQVLQINKWNQATLLRSAVWFSSHSQFNSPLLSHVIDQRQKEKSAPWNG